MDLLNSQEYADIMKTHGVISSKVCLINCVFATINPRNQALVLQKNTWRRRLAGNLIQMTLLLFEIEWVESPNLKKSYLKKF